jgi:hypothetical protein
MRGGQPYSPADQPHTVYLRITLYMYSASLILASSSDSPRSKNPPANNHIAVVSQTIGFMHINLTYVNGLFPLSGKEASYIVRSGPEAIAPLSAARHPSPLPWTHSDQLHLAELHGKSC